MAVTEDATAIGGELAHLRRAIHAEPEIGLHLPLTQEKILVALDGLPLEVTRGSALTSVTAVLRGGATKDGGKGEGEAGGREGGRGRGGAGGGAGGGGAAGRPAAGRHGRAAGHRTDRAGLRVPDRRHHARLRA